MRVAIVSTYPPRACGIGTFSRDLRVHHYEQEQIAQFFPKIRFVFGADCPGDLVSFLDRRRQERLMCLFAVPRTTVWGTQLRNDVAQFFKRRAQIRQSERCVPNSAISPENFRPT